MVSYFLIVFLATLSLRLLVGESAKIILTLASLSALFVPLVSIFYASLYWYSNEQFTQMVLSLPVSRSLLFFARYLNLSISLSLAYSLATSLALLGLGGLGYGFLLIIFFAVLLSFIFVGVVLVIVNLFDDRMRGIGFGFAIWLYFALLHDGLILMLLSWLREYPMDIPAAILGILNPIGLARLAMLIHNDGALLLGHLGAISQKTLNGPTGYFSAACVAMGWLVVPVISSQRLFRLKDR